jgi:hypothetical protein
MLANSKLARQVTSKAFNPTYVFTSTTEEFSLGEVAAPVIAFGGLDQVTVNKSLVEYFFSTWPSLYLTIWLSILCLTVSARALGNERLPTTLGWRKKEEVVGLQDILHVTQAIRNATSLTTD